MQTGNATEQQTFPRLANYVEYDEPVPTAIELPEPIVVQQAAQMRAVQCEDDHTTSFDAILDAYAREPDRWDGLE